MKKVLIGILVLVLSFIAVVAYFIMPRESTRPTNPIIYGVSYIGVSVSDIDKTSQLYQGAVNFGSAEKGDIQGDSVIDKLVGQSNVHAHTHLLRSSNAQLRFMQFTQPSAAASHAHDLTVYGPGIGHVCYQVNHNTNAYERFLNQGATHIGARDMVQLNDKNPVFYAYARDPDGIIFEVEHVDVAALNLDTPPKNDYRIRHVSLATPDMDKTVAFYSILLEEENPRRIGRLMSLSGEKLDSVSGLADSKIEMAWFQLNNLEIEIIEYTSHPTEQLATPRPYDAIGYNSIVFDVTDFNAVKQKLAKAGGTIVMGPTDIEGGQIMYARDVDSNLLGFQILTPESTLSSAHFKDNGI